MGVAGVLAGMNDFFYERSGRQSAADRPRRLDAEIPSAEDCAVCVSDRPRRRSFTTELVRVRRFDGLDGRGGASTLASGDSRVSRRPSAAQPRMQYPPDPPRPEEIIVVMRQAGHDRHGLRMRALIAVLWPARLRISEALALNETDVDAARGSLLIRHGKGEKRREAGMDRFGSEQLAAWLTHRPPLVMSCASSRLRPGSAAGSHPISYATRTLSNPPAKASRSTSSNANSATSTSARHRPPCRDRSLRAHRCCPISTPAHQSQRQRASRSDRPAVRTAGLVLPFLGRRHSRPAP